jgi:hypothetical protein
MAIPQSLYRRVLGPQFDGLPEVLRRFHDTPGGGRAQGMFRVERGPGWLRNALATLLGLPASGTDVPIELTVTAENVRERWSRRFGNQIVETIQWARGDLLMEGTGLFAFSCRLVPDGTRVDYAFDRAWFCGVVLPRRLGPHVDGWVNAGEDRWEVSVRVFAPLLGELIRYEGWVEPK